jgi:hypothetical protein
MKHGPSQQSTDGRASPSLYFDLLADFFNRIGPIPHFRAKLFEYVIGALLMLNPRCRLIQLPA